MNNIIVSLPIADPVTGKMKKAELQYFQIGKNLEMKMSWLISFYEADGSPAKENPNSKMNQFSPIQISGTTEGNYVDPATGYNLKPVYQTNSVTDPVTGIVTEVTTDIITNGAIPEILFWQNIPLSSVLTNLSQTTQDEINKSGIKISDIIYQLLEQSALSDNKQGII